MWYQSANIAWRARQGFPQIKSFLQAWASSDTKCVRRWRAACCNSMWNRGRADSPQSGRGRFRPDRAHCPAAQPRCGCQNPRKKITTGKAENKFGISPDDARSLIKRMGEFPHIDLPGNRCRRSYRQPAHRPCPVPRGLCEMAAIAICC